MSYIGKFIFKLDIQGLCDLLGVIDMEVCHGGISNYAPIIEYIVMNRSLIDMISLFDNQN